MDKSEVAAFLGVSERTVERYAQSGKLSVVYVQGKNGQQATYKREEVELLKAGLDTPVYRSLIVGGESEVVYSPELVEVTAYEVACKLAEILQATKQKPSPLDCYRELEEAVEKGWVLPTSVVVGLIGVVPRGDVFTRGSFEFVKVGKVGREAGWKVGKVG